MEEYCDKEFAINESDGRFIPYKMYAGEVVKYCSTFGYFGLYLGQVMLRYRGPYRLDTDAYTARPGCLL